MCDSRGAMPCPAGITARAAVILDACHRWHVLSMCLVPKFTRCGLIVVTTDFHAIDAGHACRICLSHTKFSLKQATNCGARHLIGSLQARRQALYTLRMAHVKFFSMSNPRLYATLWIQAHALPLRHQQNCLILPRREINRTVVVPAL
jgi:hypothetical protein